MITLRDITTNYRVKEKYTAIEARMPMEFSQTICFEHHSYCKGEYTATFYFANGVSKLIDIRFEYSRFTLPLANISSISDIDNFSQYVTPN